MDKRVIFAVAGSGKTYEIVRALNLEERFLIVTYTDANRENLRIRIIEKFGHIPDNISLFTYFTFLHSFCYRPFLLNEKRTKGMLFRLPPADENYPLTSDRRFMTAGRWLYHNRVASFLKETNTFEGIKQRIEKYFDAFFVDEVQDFAGHDFNLLTALCAANVRCMFVGDFYQHTYDTSRDGSVNKNLHVDYEKYKGSFAKAKLVPDTTTLLSSHRCSKSVCEFITKSIGIPIEAASDRVSEIRLVEDKDEVQTIYEARDVVKLFLQEHYKYDCYSMNWGGSKGLDHFQDVCVVLNPGTLKAFKDGTLATIAAPTRNKLYVACSRARGNLTFIPDALIKSRKLVAAACDGPD